MFKTPLTESKTLWGTYTTYAIRTSLRPHRVKHPVTKQDLGTAHDELMRIVEGKKVYWRIGMGVGSDGTAYSGGQLYKTKRAAVSAWINV